MQTLSKQHSRVMVSLTIGTKRCHCYPFLWLFARICGMCFWTVFDGASVVAHMTLISGSRKGF